MREQFKQTIDKLLNAGYYREAHEFFDSYVNRIRPDYEIRIVKNIFEIYEDEVKNGMPHVLNICKSWDNMVRHYTNIKFLLRRIEYDITDTAADETTEYLREYLVSPYCIQKVLECSIIDKTKVKISLSKNDKQQTASTDSVLRNGEDV